MNEAMKNPIKQTLKMSLIYQDFHGFWVYSVHLQRIAYMPAKNTCIDNMRHIMTQYVWSSGDSRCRKLLVSPFRMIHQPFAWKALVRFSF